MNGNSEYTKYHILIGILFDLLRERKVNARYLSEKYDVSHRTVYRYLDELSIAGVPVYVERGRYGGVCVPGHFKLPVGFMTEEEYQAITDSLTAMQDQRTDSRYEKALAKIKEQMKKEKIELSVTGNIMVDGTAWGDVYSFSDTLSSIESAVEHKLLTHIVYISGKGEKSERDIEPHLLILKQNVWYVYAYCHSREEFRLFRLNRIRDVSFLGQTFTRRDFKKEDIPLKFTMERSELVCVTMQVEEQTLPEIIEWLGIDSVNEETLIAEANLPDDDMLINRLLGFGAKVKVLEPSSIQQRLKEATKKVLALYE